MAALAAAGVSAAGSILSGITGGKGAAQAAKIQAQVQQQALAQQQAQFAQTQANEAPFLGLGTSAITPLGNLVGLNGNDAQGQAIDALKASPLFQSQYGTGVDTILQNAAATGGLRGGNTQLGLANFGSSLLSQVIQNQLGNLGGLVSTGANAAGGLASAGQNNANAITSILTNQGNAQASGALGSAFGTQNAINGIQSALQSYLQNNGGFGGGTSNWNNYTSASPWNTGGW